MVLVLHSVAGALRRSEIGPKTPSEYVVPSGAAGEPPPEKKDALHCTT